MCDKNGPETVFLDFKKIKSLVLSGTGVKRMFLGSINILRKLHGLEKSGSQVMTKNGSWPMGFQYSLKSDSHLLKKIVLFASLKVL